jgi:hypothetical protein
LWEDCTQEEVRLEARKENIESNEDQALTAHARKAKNKKEVHSHKRWFQKPHKDLSNFRCFICQKMGHIARNCPQAKDHNRNKKFKIHHAHFVEEDELDRKITKEDDSDELYLLLYRT